MQKTKKSVKKLKTGLILTGGGSRGAFEIGALKVILKKLKPDFIIGTSVGAINAAFISSGVSVLRLEQLWNKIESKFVFPFSLRSLAFKTESLCKVDNLREFLRQNLPKTFFSELDIPLYVNATDLETSKNKFFSKGRIIDAVLASSALPPLYPPHNVETKRYTDGGLINFLALEKATQLKAEQLIIVNTVYKGSYVKKTWVDLVLHAIDLLMYQSFKKELELFKLKNKKCKIVLIESAAASKVHIQDFNHTKELIRLGETAAKRVLNRISL